MQRRGYLVVIATAELRAVLLSVVVVHYKEEKSVRQNGRRKEQINDGRTARRKKWIKIKRRKRRTGGEKRNGEKRKRRKRSRDRIKDDEVRSRK